ncbi:MAG: chlorophyll synthase ChlG [Hyphomicrobium sp.]
MDTPALSVSRPDPGAVVQLLKPITWFPPMWAFGCGLVSSGMAMGETGWGLLLVGVLLTGPLVCGTSQVVNDWYDRHVDAINEPNRPIPSGRVPGAWGFYIACAWTVLSLAVATRLGPLGFAATSLGLILAWAYSAPPVRLKQNGWLGNAACGFAYEGLPWFTGALVASGAMPDVRILVLALLYSIGAHGIMTLNDFKSIDGDRQMGIRTIPVQLGAAAAARLACWVMAVPQVVVVICLYAWGSTLLSGVVAVMLAAQLVCMRRLLTDPKGLAPWYNATGVTLYVSGMLTSAFAVRAILEAAT